MRIPPTVRRWVTISVAVLAGVVIAFGSGVWADQSLPQYIPTLFQPAPSRGGLNTGELSQAVRVIEANYYDPSLNYSHLTEGSINGLVQALGDRFTRYLDPAEYRSLRDSLAGRQTGVIGAYVAFENGRPVISGLLPSSPALAAGLHAGDVVVTIDGQDTLNMSADAARSLISGSPGTTVKLVVLRGTQSLDLTISRQNFSSPTVASSMLEGSVLYIRVYEFGNSTQAEFAAALKQSLPGATAMVLDLRDNGGGLVSAATAMISQFVSSGEAFELRGRSGNQVVNVKGSPQAAKIPLVVLVNGNTASASEIVSGSLQRHGRAKLVGVKTFGKGSVQQDFTLGSGGDLHLTVEHWFLPGGISVDQRGLNPDTSVELARPADMFDVVEPSLGYTRDAQLEAALKVLAGT
ncbi:MAG TPA: S41 family peptidase [Candidatus Acidoferrales bacterium]|nr:S41 family peptidase [Candidatus Acidoferrales bacterium]